MEAQFWHDRWSQNQIAFHEAEANGLLKDHFQVLDLAPLSRVFVPLCGKSHDIGWILGQGHHVIGAELSQIAIDDLFAELGITPEIHQIGPVQHYSGAMIDIFVGDIFALKPARLGHIDAVYDRAALVAMPPHMRSDYARQVADLTRTATQLVICFAYDQDEMDGPPFSVSEETIKTVYDGLYAFKHLSERPTKVRDVNTQEVAWHLT